MESSDAWLYQKRASRAYILRQHPHCSSSCCWIKWKLFPMGLLCEYGIFSNLPPCANMSPLYMIVASTLLLSVSKHHSPPSSPFPSPNSSPGSCHLVSWLRQHCILSHSGRRSSCLLTHCKFTKSSASRLTQFTHHHMHTHAPLAHVCTHTHIIIRTHTHSQAFGQQLLPWAEPHLLFALHEVHPEPVSSSPWNVGMCHYGVITSMVENVTMETCLRAVHVVLQISMESYG